MAADEQGELLVVQPRRPRRGLVLALVVALAALLTALLLLHRNSSGCDASPVPGGPSTSSPAPSPGPQVAPDDPVVRDLHFHATDRRRTARDEPPAGVVPADVHGSARRVARVDGVTVYLAPGPDFTCLGVEGRKVLEGGVDQGQSKCLLNSTVVNRGLVLTLWLRGSDDPLVVVLLPDRTELVTEPGTVHLVDAPNIAVLRPGDDAVRQRVRGQSPVLVYAPVRSEVGTPTC